MVQGNVWDYIILKQSLECQIWKIEVNKKLISNDLLEHII